MSHTKSTVIVALSLTLWLLPVDRVHAQNAWTISASDSYPYAHTDMPQVIGSLYLWFALSCPGSGYGFSGSLTGVPWEIAGAEFDVEFSGMEVLAFMPRNGFVNSGNETSLVLTTECIAGPVLAGEFLVFDPAITGGSVCFVPSSISGLNNTLSCDDICHNHNYLGYASDGTEPCVGEANSWLEGCPLYGGGHQPGGGTPCSPVPVEGFSWGRIKATYR